MNLSPVKLPRSSQNGSLVVVLGPTASGKSAFAVELALRIGGEIVGADSRQVYRGMDIGTGKVTVEERQGVVHHLIDVVEPAEAFGLADYLDRARGAISEVNRRGKVPVLVGGTGQYVWAIAEGWTVPRIAPDRILRSRLEEQAQRLGAEHLHETLARIDPAAARAIHFKNVRRVIRALELNAATGLAPSQLAERRPPAERLTILGLDVPRPLLYERIDRRVDGMFERGLVDEVESLLGRGIAVSLPAMSGIGYTQVVQFLSGELTLDDARARTKTATHRLARQQATWFRRDDRRITWLSDYDRESVVLRASTLMLKKPTTIP